MKSLFPDDSLIDEFDKIRNKYKADQRLYGDDYELISAKVMVQLNVLEIDINEKIEHTSTGDGDHLKMNLKYIACLKKHL